MKKRVLAAYRSSLYMTYGFHKESRIIVWQPFTKSFLTFPQKTSKAEGQVFTDPAFVRAIRRPHGAFPSRFIT